MTCRIGINGFGRIGRMVLRRSMELPDIEVVAVNDLADIGDLTYLLKYDSVHGAFPGQVSNDDKTIMVNGRTVQYTSERDPAKIPWGQAGVDVVIESSRAFRGRADASGHLQGGARKVLISAPSDDVDVTIVPGVKRCDVRSGTASSALHGFMHDQLSGAGGQSASGAVRHCAAVLSPRCMPTRPVSPLWTNRCVSVGGDERRRCR